MAVMKRDLTDTPDGNGSWSMTPTRRRSMSNLRKATGTERIGIDTALRLNGDRADELRLR
jgi:hypothetical protein